MKTTAFYPNRIKDKKKLEDKLNLPEFGSESIYFYTPKINLFARGYIRVVYGDHGPYVEFNRNQVIMRLKRKFSEPATDDNYYEWLLPHDDSNIKIYLQLKDVKNIHYAPKGGYQEYRKEGYADYKPGMIYVNPYELIIKN